ncbi:MAG: zinc-ribbon domain-containing protein, partial [Thermoanaerobaculia bacterium]
MIIQCTSCQARYNYDESRFAGAAVKKIKCTKCTAVFEIRNPAVPVAPPISAARSAAGPSPDEFSLDETALTEARKRKNPHAGAPGAPVRVNPMPASA